MNELLSKLKSLGIPAMSVDDIEDELFDGATFEDYLDRHELIEISPRVYVPASHEKDAEDCDKTLESYRRDDEEVERFYLCRDL